MKVKTKDEIITCLIDMLSQDINKTTSSEDYIHQGWIEALKWVLGLHQGEVFTKGKNTLVVKSEQKHVDSNS